jgi:hypothetical protein
LNGDLSGTNAEGPRDPAFWRIPRCEERSKILSSSPSSDLAQKQLVGNRDTRLDHRAPIPAFTGRLNGTVPHRDSETLALPTALHPCLGHLSTRNNEFAKI